MKFLFFPSTVVRTGAKDDPYSLAFAIPNNTPGGTKGTGAVTDHYLEGILAELAEKDPGENKIWNVNFPDCPLAECKGVLYDRAVSHGIFYHDHYERQEELEGGGSRLVLVADYHEEAEEGTDMHAVVDKYVSVGTVNNIGYH